MGKNFWGASGKNASRPRIPTTALGPDSFDEWRVQPPQPTAACRRMAVSGGLKPKWRAKESAVGQRQPLWGDGFTFVLRIFVLSVA